MRRRFHLLKLQRGLLGAARPEQRRLRPRLFSSLKQPARRLGNKQTAQEKHNAGRQRNPEDAAPRMVLEAEERSRVAQFRYSVNAIAEVHSISAAATMPS